MHYFLIFICLKGITTKYLELTKKHRKLISKRLTKNWLLSGIPTKIPITRRKLLKNSDRSLKPIKIYLTLKKERSMTLMAFRGPRARVSTILISKMPTASFPNSLTIISSMMTPSSAAFLAKETGKKEEEEVSEALVALAALEDRFLTMMIFLATWAEWVEWEVKEDSQVFQAVQQTWAEGCRECQNRWAQQQNQCTFFFNIETARQW